MSGLLGELEAVVAEMAAVYDTDPPLVSLDCRPFSGPPYAQLLAQEQHRAASLMKLAVMVELCRQVDRGTVRLDDVVVLQNAFGSVVPGAGPYALDPRKDSDPALYRYLGRPVPVRVLLDRMIAQSSNLATNALFALIDVGSMAHTLAELGAPDVVVPRGIEDQAAVDDGRLTLVTAAGLNALLVAIANGVAARPQRCELMLGLLGRQAWNDELPAGLPRVAVVAHKTGWLDDVQHDAALIHPPDGPGFALTVLVTGVVDSHLRRRVIQDLAATVYRHVPRFPHSSGVG